MILYKFLPFDRHDYFESELLRFTQPADLNDPFECLPQKPSKGEFSKSIEKVAKILSNGNKKFEEYCLQKYGDEYIEKDYTQAYSKINKEVGILSLTKNWNNALMWAHYTNSYKGFCVGFDSNVSFFKDYLSEDAKFSRYTRDVTYSEERVRIPSNLTEPALGFEPFLTKSVDWKYEEEVRVISTFNLAKDVKVKDPYPIYLFRVPHSAIAEIILGVNINKEVETKIKAFAGENEIRIYNAKISDSKFDLERK